MVRIRGFFWLATGWLFLSGAPAPGVSQESVKLARDDLGKQFLQVAGLDAEQLESAQVNVWVDGVDTKTFPPVAGEVERSGTSIVFKPRFKFRDGTSYLVRVEFENESGAVVREHTVSILAQKAESTSVVMIHPSIDDVPANILKFYVHFSAPMRQGDIYEYVELQRVNGKEAEDTVIELPFLEIEQELWSRDSKRLTLLLDPGRIKRGLKPREEMGPIFEPDREYQLVISGQWLDGNGKPLGKNVVKNFRTTDEDHVQPDPAKWKISSTKIGTRTPLVVEFEKALDHSMLERVIEVHDSKGNTVEGAVRIADDAKRFEFSPNENWSENAYKLVVDSNLEDLAGNSIGRPFDVDVFENTESSDQRAFVEILLNSSK